MLQHDILTYCLRSCRPCRQLTLLTEVNGASPSTGASGPPGSSKIGGFMSPCCNSVPYFSLWYFALKPKKHLLKHDFDLPTILFLYN